MMESEKTQPQDIPRKTNNKSPNNTPIKSPIKSPNRLHHPFLGLNYII